MEVWGRVGESQAQGQPLPAQSPLGRTWGAVLGIYQRTRFPRAGKNNQPFLQNGLLRSVAHFQPFQAVRACSVALNTDLAFHICSLLALIGNVWR